ncbi:MAG: hypothetical protein ACKVWR_14970, partial [Acidimicrobiales bacterium]
MTHKQAGAQRQGAGRFLVALEAPPNRRRDLVELLDGRSQRRRPPRLIVAGQALPGRRHDVVHELVVAVLEVAPGPKPRHGEAAHDVEQPVPGGVVGGVDRHQRCVHQLIERLVERRAGPAQAPSGVASELPAEHRQPLQQVDLLRAQPVGRPGDQVRHAPMPAWPAEPRPVEHVEAVLHPGQQLSHARRASACRGDLHGQRQSVQAGAQADHGLDVSLADRRPRVPGSGQEQLHDRRASRRRVIDRGHRQRRQGEDRLARQIERRTAGRQHRRHLAALEQAARHRGGVVEHVLAVVGDHQRRLIGRGTEQRLEGREAELCGEAARHRLGIIDPGQVDEAHPE